MQGSASTSKAATKVPIETVLKTGAGVACESLACYNNQIDNSEMFATSIVM